jgi:periplasmic mercuric ion binding protein
MKIPMFLALPIVLLAATPGLAGERSITLDIDGMTCVACPYIVQKSLTSVDGVKTVNVSFADKKADVTYDDTRTDVAALVAATTENGFPSTPVN